MAETTKKPEKVMKKTEATKPAIKIKQAEKAK